MHEDRQTQSAAHRSAERLPSERICARARADDTARAAGFRDPDDGTDISWILDIGRDDNERGRAINLLGARLRPLGQGDNGARRPNRTQGIHDRCRHDGDWNGERAQSMRKLNHFRAAGLGQQCRRLADRNARRQRIGDQMNAVEQDEIVALATGDRPEARDDGILPARDRGHAGRIALCGTMARLMAESMKDRLIKKFEDEIHALDRELKVELPREILRARELGDLRENAEYHAAKERQRLVESRISLLQKRVSEIALINIDRIPSDRAGFGSTLHVVETTGGKLTFQLVMPEDADAAKGLISTTSPIGRAFLNREEGDIVKVATPGGTREFEIIKLLTIHDEASANAAQTNDRAV